MNNVTILPLIITSLIICVLLVFSFLHFEQRGTRYFVWAMICRVVFGCCIILEIYSHDLSTKLFYRKIEQSALSMIILFVILSLLDLYRKDKWLKWNRQPLFFAFFFGWTFLIWMNTDMIFASSELTNNVLQISRTNLAIGFNIFCYLILLLCVYYFIRYLKNARPEFRKLGLIIIVLASSSAIIELIKRINPNMTQWLLPISVYSSVIGIIAFWLVYRYKIFYVGMKVRNIIVDTVHEGILTVDNRGTIIDCNDFVKLLSDKPSNVSVIGGDITHVLSKWPKWLEACRLKQDATIDISCPINGEMKYLIVKVYPLTTSRGRNLGTVSILFDISHKQKRLEQIVQLNVMKEQLFTLVSHDLREPIMTQISLIELLEEEKESFNSDNAILLDHLGEQIRSTYLTVNNTLEWFRTQKQNVSLNPTNVRLLDIIYEAQRILIMKSKSKEIEINIQLDSDLYVYGDREIMILVLRNLISNAVKFSRRGATVELQAKRTNEKEVIVSVRDQGVGMSEEMTRAIFNEEKLISTLGTEYEKGTGLGLRVSRQIAKMNGGDLWVESKLGQGSAFHFSVKEGEQFESDDC